MRCAGMFVAGVLMARTLTRHAVKHYAAALLGVTANHKRHRACVQNVLQTFSYTLTVLHTYWLVRIASAPDIGDDNALNLPHTLALHNVSTRVVAVLVCIATYCTCSSIGITRITNQSC